MSQTCYHCHEPLPPGRPITVELAGATRAMCCRGCAAVAELIDSSGLARFYALREEPAERPDEVQRHWEVFDRPAIRDAVTERDASGTRELFCAVPGVKCAACSWLIESALAGIPGLRELSVNPVTGRLRALFDESLSLAELLGRLDRLGFRPQPLTPDGLLAEQRRERDGALRRLIVAGIGMMQVMMYAIALYAGYFEGMDTATRDFFRLFSLLVATPVVFHAGWPFFAGAWRGIRTARPGMDLPVAIAVGAAYLASAWNTFAGGAEVYFDSAVMFVFLLSIARWIEMRLRHRAFELGHGAGEELPQHALRRSDDGTWEPAALAELTAGDVIRVAPGETVPADGRLRGPGARVDESLLTGEARPVRKAAGDLLIAGSLLLENAAELTLERTGRDTLLSAIRRLLERARASRPPQIAMADRLAGVLVIIILMIAAATWVAWHAIAPERAFEIALAVLVITCPCALSLATPSALSAATARLLRAGVLVVSPSALEVLARANRMVFDKTGTLTTGHLRRLRTELADGEGDEDACLDIAGALEAGSRHPIATAFATRPGAPVAANVRIIPGRGLEGTIDGEAYRLGRLDFAVPATPPPSWNRGTDEAAVVLALADGTPLARFMLAEAERADAAEALARVDLPVTLLSGDARQPVTVLAERLGIDDAHWRQTPDDKLSVVARHQANGEIVAMVGDGSNDAPVLAGADVSIAMGRGSAMASRQADVILLGERLGAVAELLETARTTRRRIRQNLTWALGYNLLAVPAAAAGLVPPWLAAIGMSLSSLLVVLNSLRIGAETSAPPMARGARLGEATP